MSMIRSRPSGVGGGATDRLRTSPASCRVGRVDIDAADLEPAGDDVVDGGIESPEHVVVDSERSKSIRPVPSALIWAPVASVPGNRSNTGGVEDVGIGVQLGDAASGTRHRRDHDGAARSAAWSSRRCHVLVVGLHAGDRPLPPAWFERGGVADLAAAAGVERGAAEAHPAEAGRRPRRLVLVQVRLLVVEVHGHADEPTDVPPSGRDSFLGGNRVGFREASRPEQDPPRRAAVSFSSSVRRVAGRGV